ncbi:hypothetical protein ACFQGT_11025 [Natrialbaceae archaeon GCM10025810]|uniref:hypothetical protein n=1 Tax=Halovalidus salilacus TaxID=3075124 RepID=UPI0036163E40
MTDRLTADQEENRIKSKEDAAIAAYDALTGEGCESVVAMTPHQTRSTWVVPATSDEGDWRVHVDPRSGSTRLVHVDG